MRPLYYCSYCSANHLCDLSGSMHAVRLADGNRDAGIPFGHVLIRLGILVLS